MNNIELTNAVTKFLRKKAKQSKVFPKRYTPKEIAHATGGYAGAIGKVADDVLAELKGMGIKIKYVRTGSSCKFIIEKGIN